MYFSEVYGHEAPVNTYVSDRETFEYILEQLEGCSAQDRMFLFAVTMQNHGGYSPDNFAPSDLVRIKDADFPSAETYLSCANSTDDAVRYLIESLKEYDEDVLVVFFGDHLPNLPDAFYSDYLCEKTDTLAERMARYTVPFFIWANYDIEEEEYELTSLNYLSVLMYKCAGISLPPYSEFLNDTMEYIPAINAFTYYSAADNCFKTLDEAEGIEAQLIRDYSVLQYNSLFDSERSQVFFR